MTATLTAASTTADILAVFNSRLAELESTLDRASCCLTDTPFVIGFGPNQYCAINEREGNVVKSVKFAYLADAPRFSRENAEALCRNENIKDGNGAVARPMVYVQALKAEIESLKGSIALLDGAAF
jgi:hypothetical protein